jgi:solute:Na+ symporter, SSS family
VVLGAMGIETTGLLGDLPLIIAFVILAAYTYSSGLHAPAMIAVVKDTLIYITVFAAIIAVPVHLGCTRGSITAGRCFWAGSRASAPARGWC